MLNLLREEVSSSFSDLWYRLGPTRPRLSTHAQTIRQRFGSQTAFIVEDPAGGQYYRLSESAYFFLGLLDGRRSVDDAWQACNAQLGDDAPTQRECIDLLSRLQMHGLLSGDLPLAADMVELRGREARRRAVQRRTGRGVSITLPLVNPEPWLERSRHLLAIVFSRAGAAAWLIVVGFALYRLFLRRDVLGNGLNNILDVTNIAWLGVVFIVLRAWHEIGHACACKAMGARCTEIGLMIVAFLFPFPYCDTSAAWRLPQVWKRVVVSAGGVIFETFVAALAAIAWSFTSADDAGLVRTLLYNTMIISGVTTLVFNLNPLLRYDGYYILSDVAGSANLAQRSQELIKFLMQRYAFKVVRTTPPAVRSTGEFWLLIGYGLLSWPYRLLIVTSIVIVLWSNPKYLTLGAALAVVAGTMWIVWPMLKSIGWLFTSPRLMGRRVRAVTLTATALAIVAGGLGLIPVPAAGYATGTVEPRLLEPVRPMEDGFVTVIHVRAGDSVLEGDPIITIYNAEIMAELEAAQAAVDGARTQADAALGSGIDSVIALNRLRQLELALTHAQEQADSLTIRARTPGRVLPGAGLGPDLDRLLGSFFAKGSLLASVATTDQLLVRCVVPDREEGYIFRGRAGEEVEGVHATIRVRGRAGDEVNGAIVRLAPAGSRHVTSESLTNQAGGDVIADTNDRQSATTVAPHWLVEVEPRGADPAQLEGWRPGLRARVRFGVESQPLLAQWWRRLHQFLADKADA